jgi:antitoxin component of MazEF toxin-antitoxin module
MPKIEKSVKIRKIGSSPAITLSEEILKKVKLELNDYVGIKIENNQIIIGKLEMK